MARSITRMPRLQPWYHEVAPRCDAITLEKEQCIFTARFKRASTGPRVVLCKVHAEMADFRVIPIRTRLVVLR